ncbi:precorrin-2 dehydrogenase/sirohydrochlorin ferrochelatase family protein [Methanococcoides burtonii]|uniref:precorrin-2 dehydrogenase n=1 Tax=Methanococcoides burtonii (strain DSM 6242 / NBRC 107633 / OCM 468 / ACE-M) TaxID=259564 RepID=Q12WM4_METBU|nr:bifunctional precorrin-2 dehydrogenase/sirohydrochlorin ferrochelatase [Methanococcoides burtonii]ABE52152.1 Siroheme synthase (Includes: Precorrin-2 dehydrogenase; Sirohydrochlorin ferrochelatase) [Methanococcoides burtonii DSM 6242]
MTGRALGRKYLPLFIDMEGRKVVVFGGGSVGFRKASLFAEYAETVVISIDLSPELEELASSSKVELIKSDLSSVSDESILDLMEDAFLVIPATNVPSLNDRIRELAQGCGILVNRIDMAGEVVIPSVIQRNGLSIGISTFGSSPAVSKYTRRKLEAIITPQYGEMIRLQDEMRTLLKSKVDLQKERKALLWKILEDKAIWDALEVSYEKGYNVAYNIVQEHLDKKG